MTEWPVVALGDVAKWGSGGTPSRATSHNYGGNIPWATISDLPDGPFTRTKETISEHALQTSSAKLVPPGSVLIAMYGASIGKLGLPESSMATNQAIAFATPIAEALDRSYLFWFLHSQKSAFVSAGVGGAQPNISQGLLKEWKIPLPPISEQQRIAMILDHSHALRTKRRVALAQLEELTQSIFLDMFGHQSAYPVAPLSDLADVSSGFTKGRKLRDTATREVPYMAVLNVQDKALDLSTVKTIEATETEINRYRLQYDDLLLTEGGDPDKLGRGTLWRGEIAEAIHQNHIFRVRIHSNELLDATYLNWAVGSRAGKAYFLRSAKQTTGIASINSTQLKGFPVHLPPIERQRKFAERTLRVDEAMSRHCAALSGLDSLFASIQARAFRGEL